MGLLATAIRAVRCQRCKSPNVEFDDTRRNNWICVDCGLGQEDLRADPFVTVRRQFYWRFWKPLRCGKEKVYFGRYYKDVNDEAPPMTYAEFSLAYIMGFCAEEGDK